MTAVVFVCVPSVIICVSVIDDWPRRLIKHLKSFWTQEQEGWRKDVRREMEEAEGPNDKI